MNNFFFSNITLCLHLGLAANTQIVLAYIVHLGICQFRNSLPKGYCSFRVMFTVGVIPTGFCKVSSMNLLQFVSSI